VNEIITRGFINRLVLRGFGRYEVEEVGYHVVAVCEPDVVSHEYGGLSIRVKELKPIMVTKTPSYYYEEIDE
jgi:hypothetical protein